MSLSRAKPWLAAWLLVLVAGATAYGQGVKDMQLFAPTEFDQFGGGARADQGFFFQFDGLYWWILPPDTDPVGFPGLTREVWYSPTTPATDTTPVFLGENTIQHNTIGNSNLEADPEGGQRYEFGCVWGHHGFMFSILDLTDQNQRLVYSDVDIVFNDVPFQHTTGLHGRLHGYVSHVDEATEDDATYLFSELHDLPVTFEEVILKNEVSVWGAEANYIYRTHPAHHGGIFEFFFGVRYFEFEELFSFEGYGDRFERFGSGEVDEDTGVALGAPLGPGTILDETIFWMDSRNHIVGPQVSLRWFKQSQRWTCSTEARFFAGFNIQNLELEGTLGTELDEEDPAGRTQDIPVEFHPFVPLMHPVGFKHSLTEEEWSPGMELRFDLQYKLTRAVDFKVGWTGFWIDGIARSSNLIDYTLTEDRIMGIDVKDNRQGVFMHGLNLGFTVNR